MYVRTKNERVPYSSSPRKKKTSIQAAAGSPTYHPKLGPTTLKLILQGMILIRIYVVSALLITCFLCSLLLFVNQSRDISECNDNGIHCVIHSNEPKHQSPKSALRISYGDDTLIHVIKHKCSSNRRDVKTKQSIHYDDPMPKQDTNCISGTKIATEDNA